MNAPIIEVTVLEDRAAIARRGTTKLAVGQHRIVIERVSPVLVDKTLTATATGGRVLDVRCERYLAPWREPMLPGAGDAASTIAALHAERAQLAVERDTIASRQAAARAELEGLATIASHALRELAEAASRAVPPNGASKELAALDTAEAAARRRIALAELAAADVEQAQRRLDARLTDVETTAGGQAARLVIDLVVEIAGEIALSIGYIVPSAAWRPYHRAMLTRDSDGPSIAWATTACVWQATGEDWRDVALVLSLERPSLGVEPPALDDDELAARRRLEQIVVEAREHEHQVASQGVGAQVPGIDDGGLGLVLRAARATIASDGAPHRVPVGSFTARAVIDRVAIPLRSPWVHVRAKLTNTGAQPLLAGPVDLLMASGYVGRADIGFIAAGEKMAIGFGPDADVRIHRSETRAHDDAGLLGGWNLTTVRVAVRISNMGAEAREVLITERIPISEVEQVEVHAAPADGYLLGAADHPGGEEITQVTARAIDERGLVSWTVALPAFGRRAVALEYKIRSQRGVAGA